MRDIHPLTLEWVEAVFQLESRAGDAGWSRQQFEREVTLPLSRFYLLRDHAALFGYGGFWKVLDEAQITNLVVAPEVRRQGIGAQLLAHLRKIACREQCTRLTLDVRRTNAAALALYRREGFKEVGCRSGFYDGIDALLMEKTL